MIIEHLALNVADPVAMAVWYEEHLAMHVVRRVGAPTHTHFMADSAGHTVLELYHQDAPVPDYRSMDKFTFHIALMADDVAGARKRLLAAGATSVTDVTTADTGDVMCFLRDPWGVCLQLVKRGKALI